MDPLNIIYVTNNNDNGSGSLREAVEKSNNFSFSRIIINEHLRSSSKIILLSEIIISSNLEIINENKDLIIINKNGRIFHIISPSCKTKISSLTLTQCHIESNGGSIMVENSENELILEHVNISHCSSYQGGGIYTNGKIILISSKIYCNEAKSQGGGIWSGQSVTLNKSCVVKNKITLSNNDENSGNGGSGIFVDNGNCFLNQSSVNKNEALHGNGGGIVVLNGSVYVQNHSNVNYNKAFNYAGIQEGIGNVYVTNNSSVCNNKSFNDIISLGGGGGGITITMGDVYISNSQVCNNKTLGMYSGGIVALVGEIIIKSSLICGNTNNGPGGGLAMNFGSVTISNSIISNNEGSSLGGGIVSFSPSPSFVVVQQSQISSNTLTNFQTIRQSIDVFLSVVNSSLSGMSKQAVLSGGSGGKKLIETIPEITKKISDIQTLLNLLPLDLIGQNSIGGGGIALLLSTSLIINQSTIKDNFCGKEVNTQNIPFKSFGGGIFTFQAITNLQDSLIENNTTLTSGGGIWNNNNININNTEIQRNKCLEHDGGGINNSIDGSLTMTNSNISHNQTKNNGGGINNSGSLDLFSCTITDNCALNGGGIYSTKPFNQFNTKIKCNCPNNII